MPPLSYDARKIAALTTNPGCARRAVLDAAGIDKARLAGRLGATPGAFTQSPFALTRGRAFEALVKANGYAELITLLRAELAAPVEEARVADLAAAEGDRASVRTRARATERLLKRVIAEEDSRLILDHPVLTLEIAGQTAYLEPDALSHRIGDRIHVVVIKSFAAIDGQADPRKTAAAAREAAVHVLALRRTLTGLGASADLVADQFLLVCPKDFSNRPYGRLIDLRQQLDAVEHQLRRLARAEDLAGALDADASLDLSVQGDQGPPVVSDDHLARTVESLDYLYEPGCLDFCELSRHCREKALAAGAPARLGGTVGGDLPGLDHIAVALSLAHGQAEPDEHRREVVERLRAAARLRARCLGRGVAS
ncbi:hypothetical protein [Streptomyces radicis]|uniref:Uncharacterized protein n=1 Tax=Streptomyces radicis TaxID=1750517 RepID=A0A3A9VS00_9ACTN|nr:hypothetical protein [Streptomyces radicis]RKN03520.1 hypothetical protein D7319_31385 [Streptomyces radicis]RKN20328.1 hypothetical protein D7318_19505 [Streptomyces radicis]